MKLLTLGGTCFLGPHPVESALTPRSIDWPVQVIDARDAAAGPLHLLQARAGGAFNACGPAAPMGAAVRQ